jgi:flavin-dependent dehydrogenase
VNVTIHEASVYPRHRVCGEFLSGITDDTLDRLGIKDALLEAVPLTTAHWSIGTKPLGEMTLSGRGISRWRLDDLLQKKFTSLGGTLITRSRIQPAPGVIWAAGRPRSSSEWIGLKCHFRNLTLSHDLEMVVGRGGYAGLARIEDGMVNVCGLFKKQPVAGEKGHEILITYLRAAGLSSLVERLEAASVIKESFSGVAGFRFGRSTVTPFSLGDASCIIPPFTGNGMSMALESADEVLQPVLDYAENACSWEEAARISYRKQRLRFRRRMAVASLIHPLLTSTPGVEIMGALLKSGLIPYEKLHHLLH